MCVVFRNFLDSVSLIINLAMNLYGPSTSESDTTENQQNKITVVCNTCNSLPYTIPHRRNISRRWSISGKPNNTAVIDLSQLSTEEDIGIVFRKRNIVWKAINSVKTEKKQFFKQPKKVKTSQKKNLANTSQQVAPKQTDDLIKARCSLCNTLINPSDNSKFKIIRNNDSESSNSENKNQWDDKNEMISNALTELDIRENKESKTAFQERRGSKTLKVSRNYSYREPKKPAEVEANKNLSKYWYNRYEIFHKYDQGIQLDEESWYSVTPERIAKQIARRCKCKVIIDAFCGAGGNTIQFALTCKKVIAIDIDPMKIQLARNNAKVYGVEKKIEFITGDFLKLAPKLKADIVFLSPPWGGPTYSRLSAYSLEKILPINGKNIYKIAKKISGSIAYFLPRNVDIKQVRMLAKKGKGIETETYFKDDKAIAVTCYYGGLVTKC